MGSLGGGEPSGDPSGDPAHVQTTQAVPSEEHQEGISQAGLGPTSGYSCDVVHESVSLFILVSSAEAMSTDSSLALSIVQL